MNTIISPISHVSHFFSSKDQSYRSIVGPYVPVKEMSVNDI